MSDSYSLFTSESVSNAHPDKLCDQIADTILDALLAEDPHSRVACEVMVKNNIVIIAGEITSLAHPDYALLAKKTILSVGYDRPNLGFSIEKGGIQLLLSEQSRDIAKRVDENKGAGDQGTIFGYATDETESFMPAPIYYAHALMRRQAELRTMAGWQWLYPDAKAQVTVVYKNMKPDAVSEVVLSTQHASDIGLADLRAAVEKDIIRAVIPESLLRNCGFNINPSGRFVKGGPEADCGLTGRKIIVDTYGGTARHGGGAMSGKDPSKVDRSAAYLTRYIAKNLVAAGLAKRCEVQLSYAIGVAEPVAVYINHFQTSRYSNEDLIRVVRENFDLRPRGIIAKLDLLRPIYAPTAAFGHFGRRPEKGFFNWEKCDRKHDLEEAANRLMNEKKQ